MKKIYPILAALSLIFGLVCCRQNNGDIGPFYGVWALDSLTVDGIADHTWHGSDDWTVWLFQNNIVYVERDWSNQNTDRRVGTWEDNKSELVLDFTHYNDNTAAGTGSYAAPEWIKMSPGVTRLQYVVKNKQRMELSCTNSDGLNIVYYLRKTY